jgi:hypothetical protein
MKSIEQLKKEYLGKEIQFTDRIETHCESEFDEGMKATIIGFEEREKDDNGDTLLKVYFDTNKFTNHNKLMMKPSYWDKDHNPTLTAIEAGDWPKNGKHWVYFMVSDFELYFNVI